MQPLALPATSSLVATLPSPFLLMLTSALFAVIAGYSFKIAFDEPANPSTSSRYATSHLCGPRSRSAQGTPVSAIGDLPIIDPYYPPCVFEPSV